MRSTRSRFKALTIVCDCGMIDNGLSAEMRRQRGGGAPTGTRVAANMLDAARRLIAPSTRSEVPPFMVMDVMAAAARIEAGRRPRHPYGGRAAGGAGAATARLQRRGPRWSGPARLYRNARHSITARAHRAALSARLRHRPRPGARRRHHRLVGRVHSGFLALFEAGDRVAVALPGYPPYRHILRALGCEPVRSRPRKPRAGRSRPRCCLRPTARCRLRAC